MSRNTDVKVADCAGLNNGLYYWEEPASMGETRQPRKAELIMTREEYKAILTIAIGNEVESYEFYKGVSEIVVDAYIKEMFREFATEELGHQELLKGFLAKDINDMHFDETADYKVSETVDKPTLSLDMKPADALALAMKNEEAAMNMYAAFAISSSDESQKKMFHDLSIMEKGHKRKIEDYYVNVAFPEVW